MAGRGGYRIWAKTDRHQADYTLRQIRNGIKRDIARNAPEEQMAQARAAEARAVEEVNRVEAMISEFWSKRAGVAPVEAPVCTLCNTQTDEAVHPGSFGDYHNSCMAESLEMDEKLRRMA